MNPTTEWRIGAFIAGALMGAGLGALLYPFTGYTMVVLLAVLGGLYAAGREPKP